MTNCPNCHAPLPADAPAGLCPACLARAARHVAEPLDPEVIEGMRRKLAEHTGDLELGELLGRGGMGYVFRARQRRLGREVAVKVLAPELGRNALFAERFGREAQALARLAHPHIVAVHDYGRAGELCYLVLEYVDGVDLRKVLAARTLAPAQALVLVPQICDALAFAHANGVVHRDVKPENILLDRAGRVKIADFGLAKLLGDDLRAEVAAGGLTSTGQVLGTLRYMAPEQMERPLEVDHRADIYSLGVVFYEMLTGEIPMGRFAPPSHKVAIDVQLDEVVLHTLEREPERRYQHASEIKDDVEAIGAGGKASPRPGQPVLRRLSWLAVSAPVVAIGGPALASLLLTLVLLAPKKDLLGLLLILAFSTLIVSGVGSALGWAALERLRANWPRSYGVGAALVGLWFLPLYAATAFLVAGTFTGLQALSVELPPWAVGVEAAALLALDVLWIAAHRRKILRELEPPVPA